MLFQSVIHDSENAINDFRIKKKPGNLQAPIYIQLSAQNKQREKQTNEGTNSQRKETGTKYFHKLNIL